LSKDKKRVEKLISQVQARYQRVLEQKRLEWLQRVCREAWDTYNFGSLGEFVAWIVDHVEEIKCE